MFASKVGSLPLEWSSLKVGFCFITCIKLVKKTCKVKHSSLFQSLFYDNDDWEWLKIKIIEVLTLENFMQNKLLSYR
jgi:hypothetical protein